MFAFQAMVVKRGKYCKMFSQRIILQILIVLDMNLVKAVVYRVGVAQRQPIQHGLQSFLFQLHIMVKR